MYNSEYIEVNFLQNLTGGDIMKEKINCFGAIGAPYQLYNGGSSFVGGLLNWWRKQLLCTLQLL